MDDTSLQFFAIGLGIVSLILFVSKWRESKKTEACSVVLNEVTYCIY